jgi:hypothetical protein
MSPGIIYFDQNLVHGKIENFGTGEMDEKERGEKRVCAREQSAHSLPIDPIWLLFPAIFY